MNASRLLSSLRSISLVACAGLVVFACTDETKSSPSAESDEENPEVEVDPNEGTPSEGDDDDDDDDKPVAKDAGKKTTKDAGKDAGKNCTSKRWYLDSDGDGFGLASSSLDACTLPSGYVADNTDCDDTSSKVKPNGVELCDAVDSNCDGNVNGTTAESAACFATVGSYAGTFSIYTAEKLGATIINQMKCTGTTALTVDLSRSTVVQGTTTCSFAGSLGGFDKTQTSTIEGTIALDGTFKGTITHSFGYQRVASFSLTGTAKNGKIDATATGGWKPNVQSAVPWETTVTISAPKL